MPSLSSSFVFLKYCKTKSFLLRITCDRMIRTLTKTRYFLESKYSSIFSYFMSKK